jgi:ABC-type sulfate/molybdate transport systems ATPase subunit
VILDEPFTGIDPITISDIQSVIRQLGHDGLGVLFTDHNVREALKVADRNYVIWNGGLEAEGTAAELVRNQLVIEKYLGRSFVHDPEPDLPRSVAPPNERLVERPTDQAATAAQADGERHGPSRITVFVSYNHHDRPSVDALVARLEARGVQVAIDHRILRLGEPWQSKLQMVVNSAGAAIVVLSQSGMGSWQEMEIQACLDENRRRGLRVIPLLLPGAAPLTELGPFLRQLHGMDLRQGMTQPLLDQLARDLVDQPQG